MGNPRTEPHYSDAAREFASTHYREERSIGWHEVASAYDAALATLQPCTITTAAELDALPWKSAIRDRDGSIWFKRDRDDDECWMLDIGTDWETSQWVSQFGPLTLLAPVPAATPEPVRLTPEDPRWRDGAKVRGEFEDGSAIEGIITRGYRIDGGAKVFQYSVPRSYFTAIYLLAEAPDPDAEKRQAIAEVVGSLCGVDITDGDCGEILTGLRERGVVEP